MVANPVLSAVLFQNSPVKRLDGTFEYDFSRQSQRKASKTLYKYVLNDLGKTSQEAINDANIYPNNVRAFKTDLDGDGIDEIIGFVYASYYWGTAGYSLFILKKNDIHQYDNIAYILNFEPQKNSYILPDKTNGYKDIKFYGSSAYRFKPLVAKYNKRVYCNDEQVELLKEYLRDFSGYDVSEITGIEE